MCGRGAGLFFPDSFSRLFFQTLFPDPFFATFFRLFPTFSDFFRPFFDFFRLFPAFSGFSRPPFRLFGDVFLIFLAIISVSFCASLHALSLKVAFLALFSLASCCIPDQYTSCHSRKVGLHFFRYLASFLLSFGCPFALFLPVFQLSFGCFG